MMPKAGQSQEAMVWNMEHGTWREKELAQIYGWFKLLLGRASKTGCWLYMQPGELGSAAMPNLARHKSDWSPAKILLAIS